MDLVSLQGAMVRVHTRKGDIFAEIVPPLLAKEAVLAWHARLDGHSVSRLELGDPFAALDNHSRALVTEYAVALDD
jgi:hypothetical protein